MPKKGFGLTSPVLELMAMQAFTDTNKLVDHTKPPVTPGALITSKLFTLSSLEKTDQAIRTTLVKKALTSPFSALADALGRVLNAPSLAEWVGGLLFLPILNQLVLMLVTVFEFGIRTAGAAAARPMIKLFQSDVSGAWKTAGALVLSPIWFLGQALQFAADIIASGRLIIDSAAFALNLGWWFDKVMDLMGRTTDTPSFSSVMGNFIKGLASLIIPAASIMAMIYLAELANPFIQWGAGQLTAVAIATTYMTGAIGVGDKLLRSSLMVAKEIYDESRENRKKEKERQEAAEVRRLSSAQGRASRASSSIGLSPMTDNRELPPDTTLFVANSLGSSTLERSSTEKGGYSSHSSQEPQLLLLSPIFLRRGMEEPFATPPSHIRKVSGADMSFFSSDPQSPLSQIEEEKTSRTSSPVKSTEDVAVTVEEDASDLVPLKLQYPL